MEDYKNEQWWIELQQSLDGFDDSKMSDSDLGRWNGSIIGGRKGGNANSKSGHMSKLGKLNGKKNANSPNAIAAAKIQGKKNVDNKFWEKLTHEQRSKGGKESYKNHIESGHMERYRKMGAEASTKARIERGLLNKKMIIDSIETDIFDTATLRRACDAFGYKSWKSVLKEKSLVEQIHKGYNQFNPSVYKKVI